MTMGRNGCHMRPLRGAPSYFEAGCRLSGACRYWALNHWLSLSVSGLFLRLYSKLSIEFDVQYRSIFACLT